MYLHACDRHRLVTDDDTIYETTQGSHVGRPDWAKARESRETIHLAL